MALALGCASPEVQLAAPVPAPVSPSAAEIASTTFAVEARDLRQDRQPELAGVSRVTMGIPVDVVQAGGLALAPALELGLRSGLRESGWSATPSSEESAGWRLRLNVDELWCDGYFNEMNLALAFRLHLLDPAGQLRARAERRETLVLPYKHPADLAYQVTDRVRLVLTSLLRELNLAEHLGAPSESPREALSPAPAPETSPEDTPPVAPAARCASCAEPTEPGWRHCPSCGAKLR